MIELKIGEVGLVHGQVVKCVEGLRCNGCAFQDVFWHVPCGQCFAEFRSDNKSVKYITPTPAEVRAFEAKEGRK